MITPQIIIKPRPYINEAEGKLKEIPNILASLEPVKFGA